MPVELNYNLCSYGASVMPKNDLIAVSSYKIVSYGVGPVGFGVKCTTNTFGDFNCKGRGFF